MESDSDPKYLLLPRVTNGYKEEFFNSYTHHIKKDIYNKKGKERDYLPSQELTCGDCSKPFLTSGIPDLKLNPFPIKLNGPYLEVNAVSG